MDIPETQARMNTRLRTKTNKTEITKTKLKKNRMNLGALEGLAVPVPYKIPTVLLV